MPIYEYECTGCGQIEEALQKISDAPLETCKHCSGKLHKLVSQSSFHLKGSGWYVTDYGGNSSTGSSAAGKSPTPSNDATPKCKAVDSTSQKKE